MPESEKSLPDPASKSQRKRDSNALQAIGKKLVELAPSQLDQIPLPDALRSAIDTARSLSANEAKRRQMQYIGKLMRHVDMEPIDAALKQLLAKHAKDSAHFRMLEMWRDQMIEKGDAALQKFMQEHPDADSQQIRQLIRKAQHDRAHNKNTGADTALFRYLREFLQ
jgi:ribosome-associated protein